MVDYYIYNTCKIPKDTMHLAGLYVVDMNNTTKV